MKRAKDLRPGMTPRPVPPGTATPARILSFTQTMTEEDVHHAMHGALLSVATERALTTADDADVVSRQLVTMAAAYVDLAAHLGISPPAVVERVLEGLSID